MMILKKIMVNQNDPDMLYEYDFSSGIRGKYAEQYSEGAQFMNLDEGAAVIFPASEDANNDS